jgi:hypothetical protein
MIPNSGLEKPTSAITKFYTPMRGFVVDVADPEERMRVRVRVIGVHADEIPPQNIRWAEVCYPFSSKLAGDLHHFNVGDAVWVQFEGGDPRLPVVIGSWVSWSGKLNDVPNDITSDYANNRLRWIRIDRAGNKLELSEVPSEKWAKLVSGSASIKCDQKDGSVTLVAKTGPINFDCNSIDTECKIYTLSGGDIVINAFDLDALGGASGLMQILSNGEVDINSDGSILIGGYPPKLAGATDPLHASMAFKQTPSVQVRSRDIQIGTATSEVVQDLPAPETATVEVNGVSITITAQQATHLVSGDTPGVTISVSGGNVSITTDTGNVTVNSTSGAVTVTAPTINLTSGSGGVNLS